MPSSPPTVTELLHAWGQGDGRALDALLPIVYDALRAQAARYMRRQPVGHTLDATAVVHEAYVRLAHQPGAAGGPDRWQGRAHFLNVAAKVMRSVLVDHERARRREKRGGPDGAPVTLGAAGDVAADGAPAVDVLALDDALTRLAAFDPGKSRVVELRYFTGLTVDETADALGVSPATVKREWTAAKAWLRRELAAA